jgi:hypothetical protein
VKLKQVFELSQTKMRHYAVASATQQVHLNDKSIHLGNSGDESPRTLRKLAAVEKKFNKRDRGLRMANRKLKGKVDPKF